MRRLTPYIKPYWPLFLLAILLVFGMANADLALPDHLSKIVNIGIQQNGIDSGTPELIRRASFEAIQLFQNPEDQAALEAAYHPVDPVSAEAAEFYKRFPAASGHDLMARNSSDPASEASLEALMAKPSVIAFGVQMAQSNPEMAGQILGGETQSHLSQMPQGMNILETLKQMPVQQRQGMLDQVNAQLASLEGNMLHSLAVRAVSAEYAALGMDMQKSQSSYIWKIGSRMLLLALAAALCSISVSLIAARTSAAIARDLRNATFNKVQSFSSAEYNKFSTASLITRSTNDISQVQNLMFMVVRMGFMAPIIAVMGVIKAVDKSPNMWWLIALAVVLLVIVIVTAFTLAVPKFKLMQTLVDKLNLVTRENLTGMLVVRAFNKQATEEKRFDEVNQQLMDTGLYIGRTMVSLFPASNLIMTFLNATIIWVGAREVANATLMVGDLIAFQQYSMQIMFSFINLSFLSIMMPRAAISGERIADVLETENLIKDPEAPKPLPEEPKGEIAFKNVSFAYDGADENALVDISFKSSPGQVTSIIGSTGSGKTTLVNLIPRLYDVSSGSVTLDGVDVREFSQHDLRSQVALVPQRALLFSGTVRSNLEVGKKNASDEAMRHAIDIAQASDFVFNGKESEGLEREIAQAGANVSGGQKQRLSIARALIKDAPVMIFDDSFSALDFKTDSALRAALRREYNHANLIVVTQRVATAKNSDQILVLDDGRLVGIGKHKELLENCETYREIAMSQLSQEELAA